MNWKLYYLCLLLILLKAPLLMAQESAVLLPEFSYSYGIPLADLEQRYGSHLCLGIGMTYQPAKSHFNFGGRFSYFFGSEVKEDVLKSFRSSFDGLLLGSDNFLAELNLKERGFIIQLNTGGLIPIFSQNKARQSFKWQMGVGYIQHHIRFVDDARALTQFSTEYLEGLDRMSNGWAIIPFVGYELLSRFGRLSFFTGIDPVLASTAIRRSINYATYQSDFAISRFAL